MPEVYPEAIEDVLLGTQMVGGLMVGTDEIYVRLEKHFYSRRGGFSLTLPDWAASYAAILSGAGGGGRAGNGGNNQIGHGGRGGGVTGVVGRLDTNSDRVVSGYIGAGGAGGTSSHVNGQNGGNTNFRAHEGTTFVGEGGTAYPSSGEQDGGTTTVTFSNHKYYELSPGSSYTNGPAGKNNGGDGKHGGGGAGGNGGVFNNYTHGGRGGDGYVEIYVWGMYRD